MFYNEGDVTIRSHVLGEGASPSVVGECQHAADEPVQLRDHCRPAALPERRDDALLGLAPDGDCSGQGIPSLV